MLFFSKVELSGTCTGTYDNVESSYITSPNYPQKYETLDECSWTINVIDEKTVALSFTHFDTEANYDTLSIYSHTGSLLEKLSGNSIPSEIVVPEKTMYLKFFSDKIGTRKGFRIILKVYGKYT